MSRRGTRSRQGERGHTLIEVIVASTLFVVFIAGLYGATGVLFSLLDVQRDRTDTLMAMNVARARLVADARGAAAVACPGSDRLEITAAGSPASYIEYSSDGTHLLRWASAHDKTYRVADGVGSVDCNTLGSDGVDVAIGFGRPEDPFVLHLSLLDSPPPPDPEPPADPGGGGGGPGGGGGWGKGGKNK